jgi:NADH dehydrogenase (ubiquinone) Fe-S protein 3
MSKNLNKLVFDSINSSYISQILPSWCYVIKLEPQACFVAVPHKFLLKTLHVFNKHTMFQFKTLSDVTAVDWFGRNVDKISVNSLSTFSSDLRFRRLFDLDSTRFSVVYNLLSTLFNIRILLKIFIDDCQPVDTSTSIFKSSNWWEREVWDMFGIVFINHPDLRRILTDYGFDGYPLRKDFPLSGYTEVRYDDNVKRVVLDSIELSQEFRHFDLSSPWTR